MKLTSLCFLTILTLEFAQSSFNYDRYKVYRVTPKSLEEANLLKEFENDINIDFWSEIRALNVPVDVMVSPNTQQLFETVMKRENVEYSILIDNVQEKIEAENERQQRSKRVANGEVTFEEFMRHDEILAYLDRIATQYPDIAQTEVIGKSFEGRNLTVLRISSGGSNKPIIFAEAAIHAREWIAPPVALYIINQLVENPENADLFSDVDWIIHPVVNPDGYEYTFTTDRLWRKTRTPGTICDGTDGNRNFDYMWMVIGASSWQCTQTYAGRSAFSEVETRAVRDLMLANKDNIKLFLDIHSYGPWLLYPWGFTPDPAENVDELHSLATNVNEVIFAVRGTNFTVGSSNILLYDSSGGSRDYAKGIAGIELGYTIELPPGGLSGFDPEATEIIPVVTEMWEGVKVFHEYIKQKFVN